MARDGDSVTVNGVVFDLTRLRDSERQVWNEMFPNGFLVKAKRESPAMLLYSFAHICNLRAEGFPAVAAEWSQALGSDPGLITEYLDNVRRARDRGEL